LLDVRQHTLTNVRDAIRNRMVALPVPAAGPTPAASETPNAAPKELSAKEELRQVRSQLRALTAQFTDAHPMIQQLREREKTLTHLDQTYGEAGPPPAPENTGSSEGNRDIYGDLNKKLNYLSIAMDSNDRQHQSDYFAILENPLYPSAPLSPK